MNVEVVVAAGKLNVEHATGFLLDSALSLFCRFVVPVHLRLFLFTNNFKPKPVTSGDPSISFEAVVSWKIRVLLAERADHGFPIILQLLGQSQC